MDMDSVHLKVNTFPLPSAYIVLNHVFVQNLMLNVCVCTKILVYAIKLTFSFPLYSYWIRLTFSFTLYSYWIYL